MVDREQRIDLKHAASYPMVGVFVLVASLVGMIMAGGIYSVFSFTRDQSHTVVESEKIKETLALKLASSQVTDSDIMASEQDEEREKIPSLNAQLVDFILKDRGGRISDYFSIPDDLRQRVEFWFKIYSTYTISNAVLHDNEHPWIIFEIINLNSVYTQHRSQSERAMAKSQMIRDARYSYQKVLDRLSKRATYFGLSNEERRVYDLYKDIAGSRQKIFSRAKSMVRVQLGQKDSVLYAIKRSGRYLENMEEIFRTSGLPIELTRLPFLESSFNLNAYSKDGASGVWQFMSKTGKLFLTISHAEGIDERNHPLKATEAAATLLKQNYQMLKDWPLAVTAYNHGPGGLIKGIKKIKSKNLNDLIERYNDSYFGFASKNFYSCFLAILYTERYQDKLFGKVEKDDLLEHEDIDVRYSMRVKFIMELCELTKEQIKLFNPDLREKALDSRSYLPEGYYLKLPKGKIKRLIEFYKEVEETNKMLDQILGKEDKKS